MAQILSWLVYSIQLCIYYANIQLIATATSEVQPARRFQDGDRSNPKHRRMYVCMYQGTWLMLLSCYILSLYEHIACYRYWIYMDGVFNKESCILYIWLHSRMIWILYVYDWFTEWIIKSISLVLLVFIYYVKYIYYDGYQVLLALDSTYVEAEDLIYRSWICFTTFCGCSIDDMFNYIVIYIITHHIYIYTLYIQSYQDIYLVNIRFNLHIMYPVLLSLYIQIFYYNTHWYTTLLGTISPRDTILQLLALSWVVYGTYWMVKEIYMVIIIMNLITKCCPEIIYSPVSIIYLLTVHQGILGLSLIITYAEKCFGAFYAIILDGYLLHKHILVKQITMNTTLNDVSYPNIIKKYS